MKIPVLFINSLLCLVLTFLSSCYRNPLSLQVKTFDVSYESQIDSILKLLTLEEKISLLNGNGLFTSGGVERLGIPDLQYTDGPTGIREEVGKYSWEPLNITTDSATFFPTGTALAATWNHELAYQFGQAIGNESAARGKHILLAPGMNIIRTPVCGRNFEYFSEDPALTSDIAVAYVQGVQSQNVAACVKHFALNNQEYDRWRVNVLTDERTLREIYLPAFRATAVEGHAFAFMGAYNKFRGDWLCENNYLLNDILKSEWGFKGIVVSDWGGTHTTVKAALSGLDVEMGGNIQNHYFLNLADSVRAGLVPESVIDEMAGRVLRVMFNCNLMSSDTIRTYMRKDENSGIAYDVASEAIVLLKNNNNLLPLDIEKIKSIAIIGNNAMQPQSKGGFTASVKARYEISPLEGIRKRTGDSVEISFAKGFEEKFVVVDTGGRWPYVYPDPQPNLSLIEEAVAAAQKSDIAVIFAGTSRNVETEATDRETLDLPFGQDALIRAVTAANPKTVIVIVAGAACNLNTADSLAPALLYSWFNGSEAGNAIASVLFGDVNPSGKLPFTIPVHLKDIGAHALNAYPGINNEVEYKEGILVGYRWFDTQQVKPLYCFGHGLSYSKFSYSGVKSNKKIYSPGEQAKLNVSVSNEGNYQGKETIQVYVQKNNSGVLRAEKELRAFKKVMLKAGEKITVSFYLDIDDLAYFDSETAQWKVEPGEYTLLFASSSEDIRAKSVITIK